MRYFIFLILISAQINRLSAQLPTACNGTASAIACDITCISCNFNGFSGTTEGYPSGVAPEFCGTVENVQWLGFIAGANQATFTITPSNCVNGDGVQVALYTDCELPPLACDKGELGGGLLPVSISVPMTPGANYYLLVDGYAGDQCQFNVSVFPPGAVFEPPLGVAQIVTGPPALCPGATATYQVQPVSGASGYIWTGPAGTLFDSMPSPATIVGKLTVEVTMGNTSGQICVQAANACNVNPPCSASVDVAVLGDDSRPQLTASTLQSLTCTGDPLELEVTVTAPANLEYEWTLADSVGHFAGATNLLQTMVDSVGTYALLVTDKSNGCTSSLEIVVEGPDLPSGANLDIRQISCYGLNNGYILIDSILDGTSPFLYNFDNEGLTVIDEKRFMKAGEHSLLVQDILGCEWDTLIYLEQPPELLVDLTADTTIHLGEMLVLWDSSNVNYPDRPIRWELNVPEIGDTLRCPGCVVMPINSFRYELLVRDSNGCIASDIRMVTVTTDHKVFFPNVFLPGSDSDSGNDRFGPFCGPDATRIHYFRVADRWGQVVHQRDDLSPGDYNRMWDGKINGRSALPGVYVYLAEIEFKNGQTAVYKGDVSVVR